MVHDIEKVYASMPTRKRVLDGILNFLSVPRSVEELADKVEHLQEYSKSVYTAANYSAILEQAGAIQKCTEDGMPIDGTLSPQIVVVDGAEYYKPLGLHKVYWVATDAGARAVASDNPLAKIQSLFDKNPDYLGVYKALLQVCDVDDGVSTEAIRTLLDGHPVLEEPKHYTPFFIDQLDAAEAIAWQGSWRLTAAGIDGLALLDTVESALDTMGD